MSYSLIGLDEANRILKKMLVDDRIASFSTGDVWTLRFVGSDWQLAFQNMSSLKIDSINQLLKGFDESLFKCTDPEEIGWSAVLASITRRNIKAVSVDSQAALTMVFEGDVEITIRTDVDVVDWQWCINRNGSDPYAGQSELACYWKGEISYWSTS